MTSRFQDNLSLYVAGNLGGVVLGGDEEAQLQVDVVRRKRKSRGPRTLLYVYVSVPWCVVVMG